MQLMSEEFVSVSEQRKRDKAIKDAAVAKKRNALSKAMQAGLASTTELSSKFIKNEWIGIAGTVMLATAGRALKDKTSALVADHFLPLVKVLDDNDEPVLANRFAAIAFEELLNIVFKAEGEYLAWANAYREQQIQEFYHAVAKRMDTELRLLALSESHPQNYFTLIKILNNPAYSTAAKCVAQEAALRALNPYEQVQQYFAQGNEFSLPAAASDAPVSIQYALTDLQAIGAFLIKTVTNVVPEDQLFWEHKTVVDPENDGLLASFLVLAQQLDTEEVLDEVSSRAHDHGPCDVVISWEEEEFGGYPLNKISHEQSFIRGRQHDSQASDLVRKCVSNVQNVRYVVNDFILDIANTLSTEKFVFGKFVSPRGTHYTKSMRTRKAVAAANEWQGRSFVSPWSVDWRGRMYPIASVLTIQSTDFEKSLLKFAEAQPITADTAYWLGVHLANTYANGGVDKLSLDARVEWANSDAAQELIINVATKPVDMIRAWVADGSTAPDEPWQFIAACEEFYALYLAPVSERRNATNLPVAVDASCSGIQILSGMIKDATAGKLVNITPSDDKQDAYEAVAKIVRNVFQQPVKIDRSEPVIVNGKASKKTKRVKREVDLTAYAHLVTRSVVKKLVMTLPYNASAQSQGEYIRDALKPVKNQIDSSVVSDFYWAVGHYGRKALAEILPQVIALKDWIAEAAGNAADLAVAADITNSWALHFQTLSGMIMGQDKRVVETVTLKSAFAGSRKEIVLAVGMLPEINVNKYKSGTMPNIVHALDASVLHVAFAEFEKPFALIHDSVLATASDIASAIKAYKDSYIQHFADDSAYEQLKEVLGAAGAPAVGDLKIADVQDSQYFLA